MITIPVKIISIPTAMQFYISKYINHQANIKIIGYKINKKFIKIPIIEFEDKTRIWILFNEIHIIYSKL